MSWLYHYNREHLETDNVVIDETTIKLFGGHVELYRDGYYRCIEFFLWKLHAKLGWGE